MIEADSAFNPKSCAFTVESDCVFAWAPGRIGRERGAGGGGGGGRIRIFFSRGGRRHVTLHRPLHHQRLLIGREGPCILKIAGRYAGHMQADRLGGPGVLSE